MVTRSASVRITWLIVAALQLVLTGAAAVADARLETAAASAPAHIESPDEDCTVPAHHGECAICQHLRTPVGAPPGAPREACLTQPFSRVPAPAAHGAESLYAVSPLPRAPPVRS